MRYHVKRTLSNLWEIEDLYTMITEFVLFGEGSSIVRVWAHRELLEDFDGRGWVLRELVKQAALNGVHHSFRAPPRLDRQVWAWPSHP